MEADYKTLFLIFYRIRNFVEGNNGEENLELIFQSAKILEDTYRKVENIGAIEDFENKVREFWELKGLNYVPLKFFNKSSRHVLSRYMVDGQFSDSEVKRAIKLFIANKSEGEFHELVQELTNTNQIVEELRKMSCSSESVEKYKAEVLLEELRKTLIYNSGNVEEIHSEITKTIADDRSRFKTFLNILCLCENSDVTIHIQEVIALSLSNLLRDCDNVDLYSYLLDLSFNDFNSVVTKWHYFHDAFLQTFRVSFERLHCDYRGISYTWTNKGTDPCLSFDQIVELTSRYSDQSRLVEMKEFLQQLGEEGFGILAEDVMQKSRIR